MDIPYIRGQVAAQAHVAVPEGTVEEEFARDGFFGQYAHLYRTHPPVAWTRIEGPLRPRAYDLRELSPGADYLSARHVVLENADVVDVIARETSLAAILLDVDNGPGWASFRPNARLYAPPGLASAHAALGPGGVYAVWSGYEEASFVGALRRAGFSPEVVPLHEKGTLAARAYLGKKP